METPLNTNQKFLGGDGAGFTIDSDQNIQGDVFGPVPSNPHSGLGLPQLGGSGSSMVMLLIFGGLVIYLITRKKK